MNIEGRKSLSPESVQAYLNSLTPDNKCQGLRAWLLRTGAKVVEGCNSNSEVESNYERPDDGYNVRVRGNASSRGDVIKNAKSKKSEKGFSPSGHVFGPLRILKKD